MSDSEMIGYAPTLTIQPVRPTERELYRTIWQYDEYRITSPGESLVTKFLELARPKQGASILDLGAGTGRAGLMLAVLGQMDVTMVDFVPASTCLDSDIRPMLETQSHTLRFVEADLTDKIPVNAAYSFCSDVLEHIEPANVDTVLDNILLSARNVFFHISTVPDVMGALVGYPLHLSVHDYAWWKAKFDERDCLVYWSQDFGNSVGFYVSSWVTGEDVVSIGILNTDEETVKDHVRENLKPNYQQARPFERNDCEVMTLGGSPSLADHLDQIRQMRAEGVKLVTLNGAYNWCLENGLVPSAQIVVDAREFNARFTKPIIPDCRYLLASQCHPSVYEGIPHEQVIQWHTSAEFIRDVLQEFDGDYYGIPGGSNSLLRAIPLLRLLGYSKFHLFGCDCCLSGESHHAYQQTENDVEPVLPVTVNNGRIFYCHPWMVSGANEFVDLVRVMGDEIELSIYGDGLLKHIIDVGFEEWERIDNDATVPRD